MIKNLIFIDIYYCMIFHLIVFLLYIDSDCSFKATLVSAFAVEGVPLPLL